MPALPPRSVRALTTLLAAISILAAMVPSAVARAPMPADVIVPGVLVLTFRNQPSVAAGGISFTQQPVVHSADASGNPRVGDNVTIGILPGTGDPGATIDCKAMTLLTDAEGNATFEECFIDKAAHGYRLSAQVLALSTVASMGSAFDVIVGSASKLSFVSSPVDAFLGHPFDVAVGITDEGRNVVTSGIAATIALGLAEDTAIDVTLSCAGGLQGVTATSGSGAGTARFSGCLLSDTDANGEDIKLQATASAVTGSIVLTSGLSPGIPLDQAVEAPLPALTVLASPSVLTWGNAVTISFTYAGGAGKAVDIQRTVDGKAWTLVGRVVADGAGRGSFIYRPRTTAGYRAAFTGQPIASTGSTDFVNVVVRLQATQSPVHASTTVLKRGTTVTFTTRVRPSGSDLPAATVEFRLYRRVAGVWSVTLTRRVVANSAGTASFAYRFGTAGEFYVRSRALGSWHGTSADPGSNFDSLFTPIARYSVK